MATTNILQFSPNDIGTNLLTDAAYLAASDRSNGNQPGVASAKLNNKALRQATAMAAGLAQYMANKQATNVTDALTPSQIATMLGAAFGGQLIGVRVITATGVYTPTAGTKSVLVRLVGGGAGGGTAGTTTGVQYSAGPGGGAGGYAESYLTTGFSGVTVTIGAGGGGSAAGSTSSFGALMTATGGAATGASPGLSNTVVSMIGQGPGGIGSGGNIYNAQGASGTFGIVATTGVIGGTGGGSVFGPQNSYVSSTTAGNAGFSPGAGGGGGSSLQGNGSNTAGGSGAAGLCVIYEFGG